MARRKRRKAYFRRAVKGIRRAGKKSGVLGMLVGAGLYGAFREKVSAYISPYTSKLPLGNISDETGMIALSYLGKKFIGGRVPIAGDVFKAGMLIEAARIGEAVATGTTGLSGLGMSAGTPQPTNIAGAGMHVYS